MPKSSLFYACALALIGLGLFALNKYVDYLAEGLTPANNKPIPYALAPQSNTQNADVKLESKGLDENSFLAVGDDSPAMKEILLRFNSGDLAAALALARAAKQNPKTSTGFKAWIDRQMPVLLTSAAWQELKSDRCFQAIDLLREANTISQEPSITRGLAYCYSKLQNNQVAAGYFNTYLKSKPDDVAMVLMYADTLESDLRFDDAVLVLEAALLMSPTEKSLDDALKSMRAKATESPKQQTLSSANFRIIYTPENSGESVDHVSETLESALTEFTNNYGFSPPKSPIDVILYPKNRYNKVNSSGPDWAAGIFDGRIRIPMNNQTDFKEAQKTLRHELVHALLANMSNHRMIASWFNEGLAQILECQGTYCQPSSRIFPPQPGSFLSKEDLDSAFSSYDAVKAERSYRQSLFLIYNLLNMLNSDVENSLQKLVRPINDKGSLDSDSLLAKVGLNFERLYKQSKKKWDSQTLVNF